MITSLRPATKHESMTGTQPVTWNSGTMRMNEVGCSLWDMSLSSGSLASASTPLRAENAMSEFTTARWVDTAPFGRPVVPEV